MSNAAFHAAVDALVSTGTPWPRAIEMVCAKQDHPTVAQMEYYRESLDRLAAMG
jgi:hypothetical protein